MFETSNPCTQAHIQSPVRAYRSQQDERLTTTPYVSFFAVLRVFLWNIAKALILLLFYAKAALKNLFLLAMFHRTTVASGKARPAGSTCYSQFTSRGIE